MDPTLNHMHPFNTFHTISLMSFLILSSHIHLGLPSSLLPSGVLTRSVYAISRASHECYSCIPHHVTRRSLIYVNAIYVLWKHWLRLVCIKKVSITRFVMRVNFFCFYIYVAKPVRVCLRCLVIHCYIHFTPSRTVSVTSERSDVSKWFHNKRVVGKVRAD